MAQHVEFQCPRCSYLTVLAKDFLGSFTCGPCGHRYKRTELYPLPPGFAEDEDEAAADAKG